MTLASLYIGAFLKVNGNFRASRYNSGAPASDQSDLRADLPPIFNVLYLR
jgi:hypothetical protein